MLIHKRVNFVLLLPLRVRKEASVKRHFSTVLLRNLLKPLHHDLRREKKTLFLWTKTRDVMGISSTKIVILHAKIVQNMPYLPDQFKVLGFSKLLQSSTQKQKLLHHRIPHMKWRIKPSLGKLAWCVHRGGRNVAQQTQEMHRFGTGPLDLDLQVVQDTLALTQTTHLGEKHFLG